MVGFAVTRKEETIAAVESDDDVDVDVVVVVVVVVASVASVDIDIDFVATVGIVDTVDTVDIAVEEDAAEIAGDNIAVVGNTLRSLS